MEENRSYQYYVVEIINPLSSGFPKYVCVPNAWMGLPDIDTQKAIIKYPIEEVSITTDRVEKKEKFLLDWPIFEVFVKYATNSYRKAIDYILELGNELINQKGGYIEKEEKGNEQTTSTIKSCISEVNSELEEHLTLGTEVNIYSEIVSPEMVLTHFPVDPKVKKQNEIIGNNSTTEASSLEQENTEKESRQVFDLNRNKNSSPATYVNSDLTNELRDCEIKQGLFDGDFLNTLKNLNSCLEMRYQNMERSLHECKKQFMITKTMIKLAEHIDNVDNQYISEIENKLGIETKQNNHCDEKFNGIDKAFVAVGKTTASKLKEGSEITIRNNSINNLNDVDNIHVVSDNSDNGDVEKDSGKDLESQLKFEDDTLEDRDLRNQLPSAPQYQERGSEWTLLYREKTEIHKEPLPGFAVHINVKKQCNCKKASLRDSYYRKIY